MNEQYETYEQILDKISMLDALYNNEFVTIEEYWKIKNRILDRLIEVKEYYKQIQKDINAKQ